MGAALGLVSKLRKSPVYVIGPLFIVNRWLRLTPLLLFLIFTTSQLAPMLNKDGGPYWASLSSETSIIGTSCSTDWWKDILYINNFKSTQPPCFGHTWYLANDMQFSLFCPLLVWVYTKRRSFGYVLVAAAL